MRTNAEHYNGVHNEIANLARILELFSLELQQSEQFQVEIEQAMNKINTGY